MVENYSLDEVVGQGQYGKVYKAKNVKTGKIVAIKVVKISKFKENPKLEECTVNEIKTLSQMNDHKHVVKFIELLRSSNNYYFVYEYCSGGTLEDHLKRKTILKEKEALQVLSQLLEAFKTLTKSNIMHRDLKPTNILLHNGIIKLADFGFCKSLAEPNQMAQTMLGSPLYMAPEILRGEQYCIKADIWSLGVVFYELLFGFCPFEEKSIARLINLLAESKLTIRKDIQKISMQTEALLHGMLQTDPEQRISWEQLFEIKISKEGEFVEKIDNLNLLNDQKEQTLGKQSSKEPKSPVNNISPHSITSQNVTTTAVSHEQNIPSANILSPVNAINTPSKNVCIGMAKEDSHEKKYSQISSENKTTSSSKYPSQGILNPLNNNNNNIISVNACNSNTKSNNQAEQVQSSIPSNFQTVTAFNTVNQKSANNIPMKSYGVSDKSTKPNDLSPIDQSENLIQGGFSSRAQQILISQGISPSLAVPQSQLNNNNNNKFPRQDNKRALTTMITPSVAKNPPFSYENQENYSQPLGVNNNITNVQFLKSSGNINSFSDQKGNNNTNTLVSTNYLNGMKPISSPFKKNTSPQKNPLLNQDNTQKMLKERNKLIFSIQVLNDLVGLAGRDVFTNVLPQLSHSFYDKIIMERSKKVQKLAEVAATTIGAESQPNLLSAIQKEAEAINNNELFSDTKQVPQFEVQSLEEIIKSFVKTVISSKDPSEAAENENNYVNLLRVCVKLLDIFEIDEILASEPPSRNIESWQYNRELKNSDRQSLLLRIFRHNNLNQ